MRQKLFVALLVLITAAYCWGLGWIAWGFVRAGGTVGYGLALGVVILLALTVWVTWREVLFGIAAGRLAGDYVPPADAVGDDPRAEFEAARAALQGPEEHGSAELAGSAAGADDSAGSAAGADDSADRVDSAGSDDSAPWTAWFRLALAYDALRDRKNARMATRRAIDARRARRS